ncbi:uncharacterized protein C1orf198 homolog [Bombina bombina]|uniref:uncharacterized protein C1orf198 homolog n=1 Tax=Bombina bombina TaxID=8345 RepID=UPI00235A5041|nr:uncharacterized protein C1orf198 homolog [Bombina bombina]
MASMAAAIAAARTSSMCVNRPLDDKERNRFAYFSSLNSMAKKIMQDKEKIRQRYGPEWDKMPPKEQDEAIDKNMMDPQLQTRYALHRGATEAQPVSCYPVLRTQTGQKVVHFGEEDITWQDEHSAPFSWETRSQMDFNISSSTQESSNAPVHTEQKQTPKAISQSNQIKTPHGNQPPKVTQVPKTPSGDGSAPARKEEESPFWKISMERSRIEGSQSEFHSLTPSQIKSLEKGEKPLTVCCRQDPCQKEKDTVKQEKTEKTSVVTWQPKTTTPSMASVNVDLEKPRPSQSSVSTLDDVFLPEPEAPAPPGKRIIQETEEKDESALFSQINTSSVLLKTGFDFLDNW